MYKVCIPGDCVLRSNTVGTRFIYFTLIVVQVLSTYNVDSSRMISAFMVLDLYLQSTEV